MNFLQISHFKCFEDIDIFLNRLTIMAGANGNGKSTAIQALLFLRYTIERNGELTEQGYELNPSRNTRQIDLNGPYCLSLGNSSSVLNNNYNGNDIFIGLHDETEELSFTYEADNKEPQLFLKIIESTKPSNIGSAITAKDFYYLNAERVGPRITQGFQNYDFPNAGYQGEFVAQLISEKSGLFPVEKDRYFPGTTNPGLEFQVNEWLSFLMPNVKIKAKQSAETHTSQIQIENSYTQGDPKLATNLGFGISYVLPIIANGLVAKKGSFLIVENPEAHLHPSAQSKIGRFLAIVANAGVQVIVETHSDHIINGIQIAVVKKEIRDNSLVSINFFSEKGTAQPDVQRISISDKGELSEWPFGFFDQTQIDFAELFKLRKG